MNKFFGKYQILSLLGEGGMGKVYKAVDPELKRVVALKILTSQNLEYVQRFILETRAVAKLNHPNLIKVYQTGVEQGAHFFTMECIEGVPFNQFLEESSDLKTKLSILTKVASAIHYCHENKVIHRDLKPSNIMIRHHNASPVVMDFGLAKNAESDFQLTKTGQLLGTPVYMLPEQAASKNVDGRSDIYSIGIIMYKVLTGAMPYDAVSLSSLLCHIIKTPIVPVHKTNPNIPLTLSKICQKATAKKPKDRYQTALALAQDLKNFQRNKKVHFYPKRLLQKIFISCMLVLICVAFFVFRHKSQQSEQSSQLQEIFNAANPMQQIKSLYQQGFYEESYQKLKEILPSLETKEIAYEYLVYTCVERKEYQEAMKYYSLISPSQQKNEKLYLAIAQVFYHQKNADAAKLTLNKITKSKKYTSHAFYYQGLIAFRQSEYKTAIFHFRKALRENLLPMPVRINLEYHLGLCHYRLQQFESAVAVLQKILPYAQQEFSYIYLAKCYLQQKRWKKAIQILEQGKYLGRNSSEYFYLYGQALEKQNDTDNAYQAYAKSLKLDILNIGAVEGVMRTNLKALSIRDEYLTYSFHYFDTLTQKSSHISNIYSLEFKKIENKYEKYYLDWLRLSQKKQATEKLLQKIASTHSPNVYNIAAKGIVSLRYQTNLEQDISQAIHKSTKQQTKLRLTSLLNSIKKKKKQEKKNITFYYMAKNTVDAIPSDNPLHAFVDDDILKKLLIDTSLDDKIRYLTATTLAKRMAYATLDSYTDTKDTALNIICRLVLHKENVKRYAGFPAKEGVSDFLLSLIAKHSMSRQTIRLLQHSDDIVRLHAAIRALKESHPLNIQRAALEIVINCLKNKKPAVRSYTNFLFWRLKFASNPKFVSLFIDAATDPSLSVKLATLKNYNTLHKNKNFIKKLTRNKHFIHSMEQTLNSDHIFTLRVLAGVWLQSCDPKNATLQKVIQNPKEVFLIRFTFSLGVNVIKISFRQVLQTINNLSNLLEDGDSVLRGAAYLATASLGYSLIKYIEKEQEDVLKARLILSHRIKSFINLGASKKGVSLLQPAQNYKNHHNENIRLACYATLIALNPKKSREKVHQFLLSKGDAFEKKGGAIGYYAIIEDDLPQSVLFSQKFHRTDEEEYNGHLKKLLTAANKKKKYEQYVFLFTKAIELFTHDTLFYERALIHELHQQYKKAAQDIAKAIEISPKNRYKIAQIRIFSKLPSPLANHQTEIKHESCSQMELKQLCQLYIDLKQPQKAFSILQKYANNCLEKGTKRVIHLLLHQIYKLQGKTKHAQKHLAYYKANNW